MDILQTVFDYLLLVPDWAILYAVPAALLVAAIGFIFAARRRWFFSVAAIAGAFGSLTAYAKSAGLAYVYLIAVVALSAVLSLLFLIPAPGRREKRKPKKEKIFERFHEELFEKPYKPEVPMPPKVCCFEKDGGVTARESGVSLSYADTLLKKLRSKKLNTGDRLEAEELLRCLDCYREKPLDEGERSSLNDCLASVLKLTAKYQL